MKRSAHNLILAAVMLVFAVIPSAARANELSFVKSAYETLITLSDSRQEFRASAVSAFREAFSFDGFKRRVFQDLDAKLSGEQKNRLAQRFEDLFFRNLYKEAENLGRQMIRKPRYRVESYVTPLSTVILSGKTPNARESTLSFFVNRNPGNANYQIIDINVNGALLSLQYRSMFNRILRDRGFEGLLARIDEKRTRLPELP